ncbi:extracellular solute-binding protein [Cryobacterium melibiosiphilum]|uniref:Extracellular solute-binding protein n=1 Tax=Cryobacterium melibiosiphilum TaxID=995039 RepID=A0A3A5MLB8_9MICO|nr:extracellular solute-binding protein [Cryobacterium melibiosiphilum]RJT87643.1 extracellular solute-binding protein [Cryobacterium melibiosiphilum]
MSRCTSHSTTSHNVTTNSSTTNSSTSAFGSRRRTLGVAGAGVVLAIALSGCSTPDADAGSASGDVTVTFMEAMSSGALKPSLEAATARFEADNPGITVELIEQPDYGTLFTKIESSVAAGAAPTIAQVNAAWAVTLADSDVILPLDDRVAGSATYDSFYDGIKNDMTLVDGQNWMWPFNKSLYVQYFNSNLVADAPSTWTEFATTARDVSTDGVVAVSTDPGGASGIGQGSELVGMIAESNGGSMFDDEGVPTFTDPEVISALEYLVGLQADGALAAGTNYPGQQALGAEKGAFDLSTVASYQYNLAAVDGKFEMGVATLPEGTEGASNALSGTNIAMFADATDAEQDAAWQYMEFLASSAETAEWAAATGYLPVTPDAIDEPVYADYIASNPWVSDVIAQLDIAVRPTPRPWTTDSLSIFAAMVSEALAGASTPADALERAQDAALALVK